MNDLYQIPKHLNKPKWVKDHFDYLNIMEKKLNQSQKQCTSILTTICQKYEIYTDKGPTGPYYIKHNYTEIYGDLLRYYKDRKNNVLEIGIRQGGSLKMWKDFFHHSIIHGIDVDTSTIETDLSDCVIMKGDAYSEETIERYFKNKRFDVIIDDGSHTVPDQVKCLNLYSKLLTNDGILIIEDISSIKDAKTIIKNFQGRVNKCSIIDRTHCVPSLDDINVIYYN